MNRLFFEINYIDWPLILFIAKILVFFAVVYFASYLTNLTVLKKKIKQILTIIFLVGIQISFYFLLMDTTNLLVLCNLLTLTVCLISLWILIGKQLFPNYYNDSIICLFSIVFKVSLITIFAIHKTTIKDSDNMIIVIVLGLVSFIATIYFFKQYWTKYLKIVLINKILAYINTFKPFHYALNENNISLVLFSQNVFVLISLAFSVNSTVMFKKLSLILKKQNIQENFSFINVCELDNAIKSLQMHMLVNKRSEKELKIIVNGYQRECLN
ncbi:hypothetical protein [Spiroplasma citri]|uniref:hypothetical protein n=1 Tax=Spiroplasma citri TaxID=2133 RepID=UPI0013A09DD5|nr:hypothetical protein [Spiroplasma citri]QIA75624.1 hypothetical protein GTU57_08510 [Spiroplasma citri]